MQTAKVNGTALEYEVSGSGEPVLLIGTGPFADSFLPLMDEEALCGRYRLIRYRQRGQSEGSPSEGPTSFAAHAADAAALLEHLGVVQAHVAGHSTGATIALQLALDRPDLVHTLVLLEPPLMGVPSASEFFQSIGPAMAAFDAGDPEAAMERFLSVVTSLDWATCRRIVDGRIPAGVAQAMSRASTFFGSYLPALQEWRFGQDEAVEIESPVLLLTGSDTHPLFSEGSALLRSWISHAEECRIDGVAHLLHVQRPQPVAAGMAEFLQGRPMSSGR